MGQSETPGPTRRTKNRAAGHIGVSAPSFDTLCPAKPTCHLLGNPFTEASAKTAASVDEMNLVRSFGLLRIRRRC
jgi:hypothetical protein